MTGITLTDRKSGDRRTLQGDVFIDGTYEGDLAAAAGAEYRLGRESRQEFNELFAGVVYMDHTQRTFVAGTTGEGDDRIVAYTYRYCWTDDPDNRVLPEKPANYDRSVYLNYALDLKHERVDSLTQGFTFGPLPNRKFDINTRCWMLGFPFTEENYAYPEADWDEREAIMKHLRDLSVGLLYFMQHDEMVPEADRKEFQRFGFAKDEFTDNGNFPWQLYVREARRVEGEYILKESDITLAPESGRAPIHRDAISAGEFPIDSFPTRKYEPGHEDALEGYVLMMRRYTMPYHIPYRIIVPKTIDGLLVPVAASATHVAFSSIRVEPTWTAMGHGAGVAAHLALKNGVSLREVPVPAMQHILLEQGTVMTYFEDLPKDHPDFVPFNYLGTMGLFRDYRARPGDPLTVREAAHWLACVAAEIDRTPPDVTESAEGAIDPAAWRALVQALGGAGAGPAATGAAQDRAGAVRDLYALVRAAEASGAD